MNMSVNFCKYRHSKSTNTLLNYIRTILLIQTLQNILNYVFVFMFPTNTIDHLLVCVSNNSN